MTQVSDWMLEQYVLGELPAQQTRELRQQIAADQELTKRIEAISNSNAALKQALPPSTFARRVANDPRLATSSLPSPKKAWLFHIAHTISRSLTRHTVTLTAAASLTFAVFIVSLVIAPTTDVDAAVRLKGLQPYFLVYRLVNTDATLLDSSAVLHAQDQIQLSYVAAGQTFGYLVSVDGNGVLTSHLANGTQAALLKTHGETQLSTAYLLDDAPDFERFFFVTTNEPFDTYIVNAALRQLITTGNVASDKLIISTPTKTTFRVSSLLFHKAHKE